MPPVARPGEQLVSIPPHEVRWEVAGQLDRARARTLELLEPLSDDDLRRQWSPLMSPLVWDLAHIGHFEELWLLRRLGGGRATDVRYDQIYDAFAHGRDERPGLALESTEFLRKGTLTCSFALQCVGAWRSASAPGYAQPAGRGHAPLATGAIASYRGTASLGVKPAHCSQMPHEYRILG